MNLSASQEDYLKLIWYMEFEQKKATPNAVAKLYEVKPPTVLSMFQQLVKMELIRYNKQDGASLTASGEQIARKLVRKHRLIETFLGRVFDLDNQCVHEEAERLEHVISDRLMYYIDEYLDFPNEDPHGSLIPCLEKWQHEQRLDTIQVGEMFKVASIMANEQILNYLKDREFKKGRIWELTDYSPDKSSYLFTDGKRFISMSGEIAGKINVIVNE